MTKEQWIKVAVQTDFPEDLGACVKIGEKQIAVFKLRQQWFAVQNLCPHEQQQVLARGIVGDHQGEPKVACPLHKHTFSLKTGKCLNDSQPSIQVYDIKCEGQDVYIKWLDERHDE